MKNNPPVPHKNGHANQNKMKNKRHIRSKTFNQTKIGRVKFRSVERKSFEKE